MLFRHLRLENVAGSCANRLKPIVELFDQQPPVEPEYESAEDSDGENQQQRIPRRQSRTEGKRHKRSSENLITLPSTRPDQGRAVIVELPAKPLNIDVDDVGERVVVL